MEKILPENSQQANVLAVINSRQRLPVFVVREFNASFLEELEESQCNWLYKGLELYRMTLLRFTE